MPSVASIPGAHKCFLPQSLRQVLGLSCPLERLNLSGNLLERIPNEVAALSRLTTLRLRRNRLHVLQVMINVPCLLRFCSTAHQ